MRPVQEDLAIGRDLDFGVGPRDPDGAELDATPRDAGREAATLGLAVDLAHVDAEREVPFDEVRRDRRRAGRGAAYTMQTERAAQIVEPQEIGEPAKEAEAQPGRRAIDRVIGHAHADTDRPAIHELTQWRPILHPQRDAGIELLPDPRHGEEQGRSNLADVLRNGID